jgi:hypothetical protein
MDGTNTDIQHSGHIDSKHPPDVSFLIAASNHDSRNDVLFDTGATHHVTGDRSALTDFSLLRNPIPLRVATNSSAQFITGQGTMIFPGTSSTPIRLKGVLYCSFVNSTLISPVALCLAGFKLHYNPHSNSFKLWVRTTLNVSSCKWLFPCPLSFLPPPSTSTVNCVHSHSVVSPVSRVYPPVHSAAVTASSNVQTVFCVTFPVANDQPAYECPHLTADEKLLLQIHCNF